MKKLSCSIKIYLVLILILAFSTAILILLPQESFLPLQELPAPLPVLAVANALIVLIFYGGLGLIGLKLAQKLSLPALWDKNVTNYQRFVKPAICGGILGVLFIISDLALQNCNSIGKFLHPSFPASIIASLNAGIGEELIFRLFFISFWTWLISHVFLKKRYQNTIFWIVSTLSALAFGLAHFPSSAIILGIDIADFSTVFIAEVILLNGLLSLFAAYYFKKYGFLAAVSVHFWLDIVWHVIYPLF